MKQVERYCNDGKIMKTLAEKGQKSVYQLKEMLNLPLILVRKRCTKLMSLKLIEMVEPVNKNFNNGLSNSYLNVTKRGREVYKNYKQTVIILEE